MRHEHRRERWYGSPAAPLILLLASVADADHGGPLRSAPMDPITVGVLAGLLVLAVCVAIALVARLLLRRPPPAE
jgi:hypothetical protein